jgi:hypothetical protein
MAGPQEGITIGQAPNFGRIAGRIADERAMTVVVLRSGFRVVDNPAGILSRC